MIIKFTEYILGDSLGMVQAQGFHLTEQLIDAGHLVLLEFTLDTWYPGRFDDLSLRPRGHVLKCHLSEMWSSQTYTFAERCSPLDL